MGGIKNGRKTNVGSNKKFELSTISMEYNGVTLYRIRALVNIPLHDVEAGDYGGWVQYERNLSPRGSCWIGGDAIVYGSAMVSGDALVGELAVVADWGRVSESAKALGDTVICEYGHVAGKGIYYTGIIRGSL